MVRITQGLEKAISILVFRASVLELVLVSRDLWSALINFRKGEFISVEGDNIPRFTSNQLLSQWTLD